VLSVKKTMEAGGGSEVCQKTESSLEAEEGGRRSSPYTMLTPFLISPGMTGSGNRRHPRPMLFKS